MKIVDKETMKKLPAGTVFSEYDPIHSILTLSNIEVKDDYTFGSTMILPDDDGDVSDYDWSIGDYADHEKFLIFERNEVKTMVDILSRADASNTWEEIEAVLMDAPEYAGI